MKPRVELKSPGTVKADINVTPLVDVVLVLLIIFMLVTPLLGPGKGVRLPITSNPDAKPDDKNQVLVVIDDRQDVYIGEDKMSGSAFPAKLAEAFDRNPASHVVIRADSRLTFGDVKKAMLQVRAAGYEQVGLITEKKPQVGESS